MRIKKQDLGANSPDLERFVTITGSSPQETDKYLTFDRNQQRKHVLEGPVGPGGSYPYRRENKNQPYL